MDCLSVSNRLNIGAFAPSPKEFRSCGSIVRDVEIRRSPSSITNLGISMTLPLIQSQAQDLVLVGLNCSRQLFQLGSLLTDSHQTDRVCRQFQVWIYLYHQGYNLFQRIHLPTSKVYLEQSYPSGVGRIATDLFIATEPSRRTRFSSGLTNPTDMVNNTPGLSSGFLVTIGWGKMNRRLQVYEKVLSPTKPVFIKTLEPRGKETTSHELVSNGIFTVLLSMAWSNDERPQETRSIVFTDHDMSLAQHISDPLKWITIMGEIKRSQRTSKKNSSILTRSHEQLAKMNQDAAKAAACSPNCPIVTFSTERLQDIHGNSELVVDVVFP